MRVLALDAALGPCSAALIELGIALAARASCDPRGATSVLPGLVAAVLAAAPRSHGPGFDAIAVTVGPGSFTGVRAALALAHGLALGARVPIVGVTTIEALRNAVLPGDTQPAGSERLAGSELWIAVDTRRGRVFLSRGAAHGIEVMAIDTLPSHDGPIAVAGDAAAAVVEALRARHVDARSAGVSRVDAVHVGRVGAVRLAGDIAPLPPQPLYVEPPEARPQPALRPGPA